MKDIMLSTLGVYMVLVSILGDFHSSILPILFNFKDKITRHILVYDDFKRDVKRAREIKQGLVAFKKEYNYTFKSDEYIVDEDSKEALESCAKFIIAKSKKPHNIYINTTDGFSTLTTLLHSLLYSKGVNFIAYDMFDNEFNVLNLNGITKNRIENNLNIGDHFMLKGYKTRKKDLRNLKDFANTHELAIRQIFERHHDMYSNFLSLSYDECADVKSIPESMSKLKSIFIKLGLGKCKKNDSLLTGGLFELYIYNIVKDLDYDDIDIGLVVEKIYDGVIVTNEFDILIMKDNHLHMIECKFKNRLDKEALVYKYIALSNIIDEDGTMIIVTKNRGTNKSKNISPVEKRGRLSNITFLHSAHKDPNNFRNQVQHLFGLY